MDIFEGREIPKEVIQSLFSFAYCKGLLQGYAEAEDPGKWNNRPITPEAKDELILEWFRVEEIGEVKS